MSRRRQLEDELQRIYFRIPLALCAFIYWELGRRQAVTERREASRREWLDSEIARLNDATSAAKAKAEGAAEAERVRKERQDESWKPREHMLAIVGSVAAIAGVVVVIFAYKVF